MLEEESQPEFSIHSLEKLLQSSDVRGDHMPDVS